MCKCTNEKVPYFNAPVYLENKAQIGKVDDIFGPMNDFVSITHTHMQHTMCDNFLDQFKIVFFSESTRFNESQFFQFQTKGISIV